MHAGASSPILGQKERMLHLFTMYPYSVVQYLPPTNEKQQWIISILGALLQVNFDKRSLVDRSLGVAASVSPRNHSRLRAQSL